jgi:hypothetical protein
VATKKKTAKSSPRTPAKKPASERLSRVVSLAFDGHGHDVWGLGCIVTGVVAALGVYGDVAGPVGDGLDWLAGASVGVAKYAVAPVLVIVGVLLVRGPANPSRSVTDDAATKSASATRNATAKSADDQVVRLVIGTALLAISVT